MQNGEAERLLTLQNKRFQESQIDERLKKILVDPHALLKLEVYFTNLRSF